METARARILIHVNAAPEFRSRSRVVPAACRGMEMGAAEEITVTVTTGIKVATKRKRDRGGEKERKRKNDLACALQIYTRSYVNVATSACVWQAGASGRGGVHFRRLTAMFHLQGMHHWRRGKGKKERKKTKNWNKRRVMITPTARRCHRDRLFHERFPSHCCYMTLAPWRPW